MADDDSGDKTEKPTPHALREARKRGDVPKSADIGLTLGFIFALVVLWFAFGYVSDRLAYIMTLAMEAPGKPFLPTLMGIGKEASMAFIVISAVVLVPMALFGIIVEFLQTGPVMTLEKMLPKMSNMNPVEGVKRMFTMDNFVDLVKSIIQTSILLGIAGWVILTSMSDINQLPYGNPLAILEAVSYLIIRVFGWTCLAFIFMTLMDAAYQHHSFEKKMKMSMRDIKDEMKNMEGDPHVKGARKQLAYEWSQEGATQAAKDASVLVVNPVHVAIALVYDPEKQKIPVISARAEQDMALAMREAAEDAGTPILRNEQLARTLLAVQTENDMVPKELFNVVAEVIYWAQTVRDKLDEHENPTILNNSEADSAPERTPPGEDLTRYPPAALQGHLQ